MIKKVVFIFLLIFAYNYSYASETITIDIGSDRIVNWGTTVNINAIIGGSCSNFDLSTIYFMEQNDRGDWVSKQSGGTGNLLYGFIASTTKQVKAQIRCPQGIGPIYVSELIDEKIINITVNPLVPIVNAGTNLSYSVGTTVNLSGNIIGTDPSCTSFDYLWEQINGPVVEITNSGQLLVNSNIYNSASFIFPDTNDNLVFKLNVTPNSCANAGNTYSGSVSYSKKTGGGRSYYARMQDEANSLFFDDGTINNILLKLDFKKENYSPFLNFLWNDIGGNGHIYYIFQHSTGSNFENYETYNTQELFYNYDENNFDNDNIIHYFRIKACYNEKCSRYSNIIKYYTVDYLNISCNDIKLPKFEDIIDNYELFLDDYYTVKCIKCSFNNKKTKENDENKLLDLYYKYSCNKCKTFDFNDINFNFLDNFYKTNCTKCKIINY